VADAAISIPNFCKTLEAKNYFYAIRLRANRVLQGKFALLLKALWAVHPNKPVAWENVG